MLKRFISIFWPSLGRRGRPSTPVKPVDRVLERPLTDVQKSALVDKWLTWRWCYTLKPDEYTPGDIRHQKEYAIHRMGKMYNRARRSGMTDAEARAFLLGWIERALIRQRMPRHEVIPALNNYPGSEQIRMELEPSYGRPFHVRHRHADGFIRELLEWKGKIESGAALTYEIPIGYSASESSDG